MESLRNLSILITHFKYGCLMLNYSSCARKGAESSYSFNVYDWPFALFGALEIIEIGYQ